MFQEVGAFDAKAKLSELLRAVREGQRYTITVRGEPVADLVPCAAATPYDAQAAVESMRAFKKVLDVSSQEIGDWVVEGRR